MSQHHPAMLVQVGLQSPVICSAPGADLTDNAPPTDDVATSTAVCTAAFGAAFAVALDGLVLHAFAFCEGSTLPRSAVRHSDAGGGAPTGRFKRPARVVCMGRVARLARPAVCVEGAVGWEGSLLGLERNRDLERLGNFSGGSIGTSRSWDGLLMTRWLGRLRLHAGLSSSRFVLFEDICRRWAGSSSSLESNMLMKSTRSAATPFAALRFMWDGESHPGYLAQLIYQNLDCSSASKNEESFLELF